MGLLGRSWALLVGLVGVRAEWYDGIPSVQVFGPEQQEEAESHLAALEVGTFCIESIVSN